MGKDTPDAEVLVRMRSKLHRPEAMDEVPAVVVPRPWERPPRRGTLAPVFPSSPGLVAWESELHVLGFPISSNEDANIEVLRSEKSRRLLDVFSQAFGEL